MKKVLILLGPTCVGKTSASIRLANRLDTEIISADSMQIYRHMDIGTAKPSPEQLKAVRHRMIDIVDPWEEYSAGRFVDDVMPLVDGIHLRGKVPLVVGGTGLYIKAMTRGIFRGPSADWSLRRDLMKIAEAGEPLHDRLRSLDPVAASRIMPHDTRRIIRALEVCLSTQRPISEMHRAGTFPLPYDYLKIGLTRDRKELYSLIEKRIDRMIEEGLVGEVRSVLRMIAENVPLQDSPRGSCQNVPAMQAIGYKEISLYINEVISLDEAIHLVKKRTKTYARRQYIWFRKEEAIHWIDLTGLHGEHDICAKVIECLPETFSAWLTSYPPGDKAGAS